jgi:hypothetical protein
MELAEQQGEQRGFAGTVGAGNADLLAGVESETGAFEQDPHAAAQLHVAQNDHDVRVTGGRRWKSEKCWGG